MWPAMPRHDVMAHKTHKITNSNISKQFKTVEVSKQNGEKMEMKMKIFIISVPKQIKIVCVHDFAFFENTAQNAQYPHDTIQNIYTAIWHAK